MASSLFSTAFLRTVSVCSRLFCSSRTERIMVISTANPLHLWGASLQKHEWKLKQILNSDPELRLYAQNISSYAASSITSNQGRKN